METNQLNKRSQLEHTYQATSPLLKHRFKGTIMVINSHTCILKLTSWCEEDDGAVRDLNGLIVVKKSLMSRCGIQSQSNDCERKGGTI